jgi:hypothetical protein
VPFMPTDLAFLVLFRRSFKNPKFPKLDALVDLLAVTADGLAAE